MSDDGTRVDRLLNKAKNHRIVSVLILAGIVAIALGTLTDSIQKLLSGAAILRSPGPVFADARVYRSRPVKSLAEEVGKATTVWFAWPTGSTQLASQQWNTLTAHPHIRLILTKPSSSTLDSYSKLGKMQPDLMSQGIRQLTNDVAREGGDVRWFDGPVQSALMICNPDLEDGWARVEIQLPYQEASLRPSLLVTKKDDPELFAKLKKTFGDVWERACSASPQHGAATACAP